MTTVDETVKPARLPSLAFAVHSVTADGSRPLRRARATFALRRGERIGRMNRHRPQLCLVSLASFAKLSVGRFSVGGMAVLYKICIDCADPHRLAAF